jgi:hypothetical protein
MLKSLTRLLIFACLLVGIFLSSAKFFRQDVYALVFDCAAADYYDIPPAVLRDPCTGVVEDAYNDGSVPALAVDCVNVGTGDQCCQDLAAQYTSQGTPLTATCSSYCNVPLQSPPLVCPYYPPPNNGCGEPNYPNKCSQGLEPRNAFCCNYMTPTPTPYS